MIGPRRCRRTSISSESELSRRHAPHQSLSAMHILEIDRGDEQLVQGFVCATWPQRAHLVDGRATAWIKMFLRSASLWSQAKPISAAVRIAVAPGRPVTTVHSFVTAKADEPRLRLV